ncbi:hypothetical protein K470DRAFT_217955 [Piedraia hortae CBS 480.64]|uniref:rRNA biogenesis protein RRP5 n=1 Tax=Piedraia hortae CBS 480.64 TaxID=1314780 RepID=A0A6A7BYC4_9PEZI|nr:hypothetical protein K470DRAFT_217955 [Piedraia hortae CBS 480.64]
MGPVKRKAPVTERSSKKAKVSSETSSQKKPKEEKKKKKQQNKEGERNPVVNSILQAEERTFPRGGAGVLTPFEHKEIRARAERDVLFEQRTGLKADARDDFGDDQEYELDGDGKATAAAPVKKRKLKAGKKEDKKEVKKLKAQGLRIHGLNYKNLVVGSIVLGCVTAITDKDIALALPNNLTGYIPLTAISETLTTKLEGMIGPDASDDDEETDKQGFAIERMFHLGQWLRAAVTVTGSEAADKAKNTRRIKLSLDPKHVNDQLDGDDVVLNSLVQASVRSMEDHGLIMDLGLADAQVKGFIGKKELGQVFNIEKIQEGQVMLCLVTGKASNGKVVKLSPNPARFSALTTQKRGSAPVLGEAPTVRAFLPGVAVQLLITESGPGGVAGKVMGMVDIIVDIMHTGIGASKDVNLSQKYKIGSKIDARITWSLPVDDDRRKIGASLLEPLLRLPPPTSQASAWYKTLSISSIIEKAKVTHVLPDRGLFLSTNDKSAAAFAHISQVSDTHIDVLATTTGPYPVNSTHRARILNFNPMDNLHYVSLKPSILTQQFLRLEDLRVGEVVKGTVEELILGGKTGIVGILVKLSDTVTGLVPETHLSDVHLSHPERKYRPGLTVKARVLSIDIEKHKLRLTLKKLLVKEPKVWTSYADLKPGMESKGTVVRLLPSGAAVQFFGDVRAWLPLAELSETFVPSIDQRLRIGQTVSVRILSVDPDAEKMKVSCKPPPEGVDDETALTLTNLKEDMVVTGKVRKVETFGVFVDIDKTRPRLSGLCHRSEMAARIVEDPSALFEVGDLVKAKVLKYRQRRSQKDRNEAIRAEEERQRKEAELRAAEDAAEARRDGLWRRRGVGQGRGGYMGASAGSGPLARGKMSTEDGGSRGSYSGFGSESGARIKTDSDGDSIMTSGNWSQVPDQENDDVQGLNIQALSLVDDQSEPVRTRRHEHVERQLGLNADGVAVAEEGGSSDDDDSDSEVQISTAKEAASLATEHPQFHTQQEKEEWERCEADRKLLVSELGSSATEGGRNKKDDKVYLFQLPALLPKLQTVNLPGRSEPRSADAKGIGDKSNTDTEGADSAKKPPQVVGMVGKLRVYKSGRATLDYGGFAMDVSMGLQSDSIQDVWIMSLPKAEEKAGDDTADNKAKTPSKGLAHQLFVPQPHSSAGQSEQSERAHQKHLEAHHHLVASRLNEAVNNSEADISPGEVDRQVVLDAHLLIWAGTFAAMSPLTLSGRVSMLYLDKAGMRLANIQASMTNVQDTRPRTGPSMGCDQSSFPNPRPNLHNWLARAAAAHNEVPHSRLYGGAARPHVAILSTASCNRSKCHDYSSPDADRERADVSLAEEAQKKSVKSTGKIDADVLGSSDRKKIKAQAERDAAQKTDQPVAASQPAQCLKTRGFDWTGDVFADSTATESESDTPMESRKRSKKKSQQKDVTGDLVLYGPRSNDDFERQLLVRPNDSTLWVEYMAFQLQLGETQRAREIAERALRTIHLCEVEEKLNIWIALLNLEVEYGDEERVEEVFSQACQVQDSLAMHQKLASIYIMSGKHARADALFDRMLKNKAFRASASVWLNYASFLMDTNKTPDRARELLPRALQSVPLNEHRLLTAKFAISEFRSGNGNLERGRTIFESLMTEWPKWTTGWDMWVDAEKAVGIENKQRVSDLYERMTGVKMKKRRAEMVFKKWLNFEEKKKSKEKIRERIKKWEEENGSELRL